ncbi:unnamed protein product [Paramecium pentaurelia]|uniref:guanylate cyclase n=1 Tax=Paramecium pentaurelia TaxID=43138 RepID=A0A8S1XNM7_9CILI|nr:unnamed protein product [Paramecium pentaurelia]
MKQLFLNYRHNNEMRKYTYQIQFRNGETVSYDGFLENENKIQRANYTILFPWRVIKENIFYFLLLILQAFSHLPLYFVMIPLILQQWFVDLHNCLKIRKMDKMIKQQEAKIIKQWDECIINKEIISKIKERLNQQDQSESNQRLKSKSQVDKNSQNKKIEYVQSQKKGISRSILSNDSIPFQSIQYKQQQSNKNIKASENIKKYNQMSPLIYKDMALKLQQIQIMETDLLIIQFKMKVPSIFPKDLVQTTTKIPLNEKLKRMEKDKMNLIKYQNAEEIKIGDVILLQRNEIAPCDIIVLHCNDENFCVQQQLCDYSQYTVRKPVVQNRSDSQTLAQFKKSLTGNIVFHEQNSQIKGFFQLKKDPQSKTLGYENFIFCQEKLLATPWILGIVVKVGNSCFCYTKLQGQLRFDNNQFFGFYLLICIIMIIQIIVFNQNEYLYELRSITQIILDNCIYLILMIPHFFKIYYNICSLFQLQIIGTIDQKQIMSCHIDKYLEKQYLTISVEAFIEQSFKLKRIIYNSQYCDFEELKFLQFLETAEKGINKQDQDKINNQLNSQVLNYDMQSSSSEILFSQRECIINQIPKSFEGRCVHYYQQDYKSDLNLNQEQLILQEQIQHDKNIFENQEIGDHLTAQRQSNQQKSSKIYQSSKDQLKQDKYLIDENTLYKSMIQNNSNNDLNPLFLQLAMNHLAFSKLLITEKKEQKVKNKYLGLLDQKQVNLAKKMGYEFICVNNVQQQQHYIIQINKELYSFKLVNTKLHIQNQRLYMLFEMDDQSQEADYQFILFLREANVRKNESIEDKVLKHQSDSLHYIYYYYCFLSQNEANLYLSSAESNISENQLYTLMEQLLKLNIIFGLSYELKQDCQDFMKNIRKSDYQLFIYTQNQEISATSILYQSELLQSNDLIFHFNQQNEEDLRAYFKQCLEEFSNQFSHASINSSQFIKISNQSVQKSNETDHIEQKSRTKKVVVILNNSTCQQIMDNTYFKNHLKLLLNFTKVLFLYQATQDQLNIVQELWCISGKTINLIYENQSLLRCINGCQLQILQLQEFSLFRNQKFGEVNRKNFFKKLSLSLRQRLIYEKCYFNEFQINSNTDVIIQGFKELDRLLFFQSPLLKILFRSLQQQTIYKTITFISYFTFTSIIYTWNTLDQQNYLVEIIFYFYIYQLFLFVIQHYQFLNDSKQLLYNKDQSLLLQKYSKHQSETEIQITIIIKNILQGILISCIFLYDIYSQEFYLYIFMSISISDWLYLIINFGFKFKILASCIFPILFYIYTLIDSLENKEWQNQISTQEVFSIILGVSFLLITNILSDYLQNYSLNNLPTSEDEFLSYLNYIHLISAPAQKKKTVTILQNKVNDLFDNIEQVDLSIQKLLLNEPNYQSRFGQWTQQIFHKAQTILQWKQKQIVQCLQLLFYHCTFLLIMYFYQDKNNYFLVDYLIVFGLQAIVFIVFIFIQLPTNKQHYLEYTKFIIATAATISILFTQNTQENIGSALVMQYFITYKLSIKFHPIYDYRTYLGSALIIIIGYIIWYIIENESNVSFLIQILQFIIMFSASQYFIKSYYIQLEEDQAQNKLNFIEQNNKINDILGILLPKFIRDRLNETDQYNIHQNQGLVAIVFCDICNFDQMVIEEKDKIIPFLDDIFRTFDKYCQIYGVQKIETVGKTYLASAGLKACEQELTYLSQVDPVQRALNLAEQMMNYIRSKQWGTQGQQLIGKIGIHYGGAISGVIGYHKPQFSLIGDTVNTTSRVCSTGLEDTITLSEQAFDQIKNENIEFEIRNVEMKGLGIRPTYIFKCKIQNKDNTHSIQYEQDLQSKDARSNYVVRKNPELLKKNLKKRKTILTYIDTMNQKRESIQENGTHNVFGIKPTDPAFYQSQDENLEESLQLIQKQSSEDKQKKQQSFQQPSTFKRLITMFQNRFQLENYEPEIDEMIDYEQLLNVILLKNEYTLEHNLIKETSFLQLLEISYYKKQMNQFISYDQYMEFVKIQSKSQTIYNLRLYGLYYMIKQFCQIQFYNDYNIGLIVLQWLCCIMNLIQFLINRKPNFEKWKILIKILLFFQVILAGIVIVLEDNDELKNVHVYEIVFIQCIFCSIQILSFWVKVLFCFFTYFYSIIIIIIDGNQLISIFFFFVSSMYNLTLILFIEQQQVSCFNQKNIFKTQQQKESQLLQYLLPKHILNKFLDDKINNIGICDKLDKLTILFADIAGFTEYSSKVNPEDVLVMLKNLFVEFDRKCCELNVYKLYTIGDCYVAIGMIDYNNRNPHQEAKNIVDLAFEMIKIITQVRKQINFDGLNMRIGIHTGSVFGGVMGTDIVRYDIYGPDVLIANKMESNGVKGFVHVSQETKAYLEQDYDDLFNFELHKTIDLKTIQRQIEGFLVHKLEQDHFPDEEDQFLSS